MDLSQLGKSLGLGDVDRFTKTYLPRPLIFVPAGLLAASCYMGINLSARCTTYSGDQGVKPVVITLGVFGGLGTLIFIYDIARPIIIYVGKGKIDPKYLP